MPYFIRGLILTFVSVILIPDVLPALGTTVDGGEFQQDTVWTAAGSPYTVYADIRIDHGITFTIEPGVEIIFNRGDNNNLEWGQDRIEIIVNGRMKAVGTETDSIIFRDIYNEEYHGRNGSWERIRINDQGRAEIQYAQFYNATDAAIRVEGSDSVEVNNCYFMDNNCGISLNRRSRYENNHQITHNIFKHNYVGIQYHNGYRSIDIQHNTFLGSRWSSIWLSHWSESGDIKIHYNKFYNPERTMHIYNDLTSNVDARFNYWGEYTTGLIEEGSNPKYIEYIRDYFHDNRLGQVDYSHWLESPDGLTVDQGNTGVLAILDADYSNFVLTASPGDQLYVEVIDIDKNNDINSKDTLSTEIYTYDDHETLALEETENNSGIFRGEISLFSHSNYDNDGILGVQNNEWITVSYIDRKNNWGNTDSVSVRILPGLNVIPGLNINNADTVNWTKEDGPYLISGDISIHGNNDSRGMLKINSGTSIYFLANTDSLYSSDPTRSELRVEGGHLIIEGLESDSIYFLPYFENNFKSWGGIRYRGHSSTKGIISHASIRGSEIGVTIEGNTPEIRNSTIQGNKIGIAVGSSWRGWESRVYDMPVIKDNNVSGNFEFGIDIGFNALVTGNKVIDNEHAGISIHRNGLVTLDSNHISGSNSGIEIHGGGNGSYEILIEKNTITGNNDRGIQIHCCYTNQNITLRYNSIYDNPGWSDLVNDYYSNLDARFNYWGPNTTAQINGNSNPQNLDRIHDFYDDSDRGMVNYARWLDAPYPAGIPAPGGRTGEIGFVSSEGRTAWNYLEKDSLFIRVVDSDLNTLPESREMVTLDVWSDQEPDHEIITLTEVSKDTNTFEGFIIIDDSEGFVQTDGKLQIKTNGLIYSYYIDELDDWNQADNRIDIDLNYGFSIPELSSDENTVMLMHFNEGEGQVAYDSSPTQGYAYFGHDQDNSDIHDPEWVKFGDNTVVYFQGYTESGVEKVMLFPHQEEYNLSGTQFTAEMWVMFPEIIPTGWFFGRGMNYGQFGFRGEGHNRLAVNIPFNDYERGFSYNYEFSPEVWYNLAVTWDGDSVRMYVNNAKTASYQVSASLDCSGQQLFHLGRNHWGGDAWEMFVDEIRISNIARTEFSSLKDIPEDPGWKLRLSVEIGDYNDLDNFLGFGNGATDGFDSDFDALEPPAPIADYVSLYFHHPEWENSLGNNFTEDIRGLKGLGEMHTWDFNIHTTVSGTASISFTGFGLPAIVPFIFHDEKLDSTVMLRTINTYSFPAESDSTYLFSVSMGDTLPPMITLMKSTNGPAILKAGSNHYLDFILQDASSVDSSAVSYSFDGVLFYPITNGIKLDPFTWKVTEDTTSSRTFYFKVSARDQYGNLSDAVSKDQIVLTSNNMTTTIEDGWSLFGIPLTPYDNSMEANLLDDFSGYFDLFDHNDGGYLHDGTMKPYAGYWLASLENTVIDIEGEPFLDDVTYDLNEGWDLISSPLYTSVDVDSLKFTNDTVTKSFSEALNSFWINAIYEFNGINYSFATDLEPWHGYWLSVVKPGIKVILPVHSIISSPQTQLEMNAKLLAAENWRIQFDGKITGARDVTTIIGVSDGATDGFDPEFDVIKPPVPPGYSNITLYTDHPEWNLALGNRFAVDIVAPRDVENEFYEWNVKLNTTERRATISWNLNDIPENYQVGIDPELDGSYLDMKSETEVSVRNNSSFNVRVGKSFLGIDGSLIPDKFALHDNFPNPFNPSTTLRYDIPERTQVRITIHDILGRQVAILVDEYQDPGYKSVIWNGRNNNGRVVGAGVYFYTIKTETFNKSLKMVLLK